MLETVPLDNETVKQSDGDRPCPSLQRRDKLAQRQEKKWNWKGSNKIVIVCTWYDFYIENTKESTDMPFKTKEPGKVNGYNISSQKPSAFLYTSIN